ncbi:FKBP-type peptidyl-prolyl cis-trans isomerase [Candidatus Micrarchaeota archaeon]|nr:FKBP-type peptidyl-prolyl cis-trans isomerase [Candidatus Micrarchaeota archaeon]
MKIDKGDLVNMEYSAKTEGVVFDTTSAEEAKKAGIRHRAAYGPALVAAGKNQVIPGLDEALLNAEEGKTSSVSIPPEKAFGERSSQLVRLVPLQQFHQQNVSPKPGMVLELDNRPCRVQSVSGGRVRVDFNHELAGKTLDYTFTVKRVFKKPEEKVGVLAEKEEFKASFKEGIVSVPIDAKDAEATGMAVKKLRFMQSCFSLIPEVNKVKFDETYSRSEIKA